MAIAYQWHCPTAFIVALARACRTFKELALGMIRAELEDSTPLVQYLSGVKSKRVRQFRLFVVQRIIGDEISCRSTHLKSGSNNPSGTSFWAMHVVASTKRFVGFDERTLDLQPPQVHQCNTSQDGSNVVSMQNLLPYDITFDYLRPLAASANINSIILDFPCGVHLNERESLGLASASSHLERFEVARNHDCTTSSPIMPWSFLQLSERCSPFECSFSCSISVVTQILPEHIHSPPHLPHRRIVYRGSRRFLSRRTLP